MGAAFMYRFLTVCPSLFRSLARSFVLSFALITISFCEYHICSVGSSDAVYCTSPVVLVSLSLISEVRIFAAHSSDLAWADLRLKVPSLSLERLGAKGSELESELVPGAVKIAFPSSAEMGRR